MVCKDQTKEGCMHVLCLLSKGSLSILNSLHNSFTTTFSLIILLLGKSIYILVISDSAYTSLGLIEACNILFQFEFHRNPGRFSHITKLSLYFNLISNKFISFIDYVILKLIIWFYLAILQFVNMWSILLLAFKKF